MKNSRGNENLTQMDYKNWFMKWYNESTLREVIAIAELKEENHVLDFGCSYQKHLQWFFKMPIYYTGYDIVSKWSDIKDYKKLKNIDVVFALNVLEHMYSNKELQTHLKNFKKIGAKKVIVALPVENPLESILRMTFNKEAEDFFAHTMPSKQVATELVKAYGMPKKYKRVNFLQIIARFDLSKKGVLKRNEC